MSWMDEQTKAEFQPVPEPCNYCDEPATHSVQNRFGVVKLVCPKHRYDNIRVGWFSYDE